MINLFALALFLLCSPIAKYEFPQGWEGGDDGGITITEIVTDDEGEVVGASWESDSPICNVRIKAGTEVFDIEPDGEDRYAGAVAATNGHGISHIEFSTEPTAIKMAGGGDSAATNPTEQVMIGIVVALMILATALALYRDRREH